MRHYDILFEDRGGAFVLRLSSATLPGAREQVERYRNGHVRATINIVEVKAVEVVDLSMTQAQREKLQILCARYHVPFDESNYIFAGDLPEG